MIQILLLLSFVYAKECTPGVFGSSTPTESMLSLHGDPDYINIGKFPNIIVEMKYATTDNFTKQNVYGRFKEAFLHKEAAAMLKKASATLAKEKPGWKIKVFDALRPRSAQRCLWHQVVGTEQEQYVANPDTGSIHNYGFALDMTLVDENGKDVPMGTPYDSFEKKSQPQLEQSFLRSGQLTKEDIANRDLLRRVMEQGGGFQQMPNEWWHFDAKPGKIVRSGKYKIVE